MKNNSKIFFCTSYLSLPTTITLIEKYNKSFIIITESYEIYKFFIKFYSKSKIILFKKPKSIVSINPIVTFKNLYSNYLLRNEIKIYLNKFINYNVYSFIKAFSPQTAYALKVLSLKNIIYWKSLVSVNFLYKKKNPSFKILLIKFYNRIMYGLQLDSFEGIDQQPILMYSRKFYKSISIKKMNIKPDEDILKKFLKKNLNIKNNKILLLSSSEALDLNIIDKSLYNAWIKTWITSSNSKKIVLKRKLFSDKKYSSENLLAELPVDWPANLLIYKYKIVIGFHSATLFEAANAGCKVISLLDFLGSENNYFSTSYHKRYITKNLHKDKKIFFPKTFKQFKQLIRNI